MSPNRTSEWNVVTIRIAKELLLFNFESLDILCASIGPPSQKLCPFEFHESFRCSILSASIYYVPESDIRVKSYDHLNFSRAFVVQFWASRYVICLNRTTVSKVMTIWISKDLQLFNFEPLDILCSRIEHPCEKLWQFESRESFRCLISSVSIYYKLESDIRVTTYDPLNFTRASVVQFRVSLFVMRQNWTFELNVMTIWISQELPVFNSERLDMWFPWIGHPCEYLWPFEFLKSYRCSMSSLSTY